MTLVAACLWAVNGAVSKVILVSTGISSLPADRSCARPPPAPGSRSACSCSRPGGSASRARDIPFLAFYGICGFALVQWLYFVSIEYLPIGIALLIEFTAPVLVALWVRLVWHEPRATSRLGGARARAGWASPSSRRSGKGSSSTRWASSPRSARPSPSPIYLLVGEKGVVHRDPFSLVCLALFFASIFWAVVQPWWSFPFEDLQGEHVAARQPRGRHRARLGARVSGWSPSGRSSRFVLSIASLRHLPAVTVGVIAMFEPVAASVVAWFWLDETLAVSQLIGGAIVLVGIVLAETSRLPSR